METILQLTENDLTQAFRKVAQEIVAQVVPAENRQNQWLTFEEVMAIFHVGRTTIHRWKTSGVLRGHKIHGRVYFNRKEIEQKMQEL